MGDLKAVLRIAYSNQILFEIIPLCDVIAECLPSSENVYLENVHLENVYLENVELAGDADLFLKHCFSLRRDSSEEISFNRAPRFT